MSNLEIPDLNDKSESENTNNSATYNQLEDYLSELEHKRNDLYEKHKKLMSDFQKSAIPNLTNITEFVQEQSESLAKTLSSHSSSDYENTSQLLKMDEDTRQVDLKIMKSSIRTLEDDSSIIQFRTEKLLLDKEIFRKKRILNDTKIQFCNYKNQIQNLIIEFNKNMVSLNESNSNFNYDRMKYISIIKRLQSEIHKLTLYLQNCEIKKQEIYKSIESSKELFLQIQNLIKTQKENNQMKQELYMRNYSESIGQIHRKKEKISRELLGQQNQIKEAYQNEKLIKKKLKKIENGIIEEQNFEECLNSKLKKYNDAIEKSKKMVQEECELLCKELEKIKYKISQARLENSYSSPNAANEFLSHDDNNCINNKNEKEMKDFNFLNAYQCNSLTYGEKNMKFYNSEIIDKYQKDLAEINYENMLLKQKILSSKKKIIESKIEFTELEQKAAALLKASVEKQKAILINQEQREICHDDYVTDTMIAIQQARAKIIMNKATIDSTSTQNKFASNILRHVVNCCSTRKCNNGYIFLPDNYIYLSQ